MRKNLIISLFGLAAALCLIAVSALYVTPWPGALFIRYIFDQGSASASAALEKHVPPGIASTVGVRYDASDPAALLDIFRPEAAGDAPLPAVVWIHGGGFVSGHRGDVGNYLKIIAGKGFATVSVDYAIAPEANYPTPVKQVNAALGFLMKDGRSLGIDPSRLILAGDSAGAQIAAQTANLVTSSEYASRLGIAPAIAGETLRGVVLFCGPYDAGAVKLDGPFGLFLRNVMWSYSGTRDFQANEYFQLMSVKNHVTGRFPQAFISAGNADPLESQSKAMEEALKERGVAVDALFFAGNYSPPLGHEYQFDLSTEAGQAALNRLIVFAQRAAGNPS